MQERLKELYLALEKITDLKKLVPGVVQFLLPYTDYVKSWADSSEFKEKYAKNPYAPFVNPNIVDYAQINAEIAWELNLPLPPYFKFIYLQSHGAGGSGMSRFLKMCGCESIYSGNIYDAKAVYIEYYKKIMENRDSNKTIYLYIADYILRGEHNKLYALIPQKMAMNIVRDPISNIKSHLGLKRPRGGGQIST